MGLKARINIRDKKILLLNREDLLIVANVRLYMRQCHFLQIKKYA